MFVNSIWSVVINLDGPKIHIPCQFNKDAFQEFFNVSKLINVGSVIKSFVELTSWSMLLLYKFNEGVIKLSLRFNNSNCLLKLPYSHVDASFLFTLES